MTGFGRAARRDRRTDIEVEIRSVNHRFLSVKASLPEGLGRHEADVERIVRGRLARGSVTLSVTMKAADPAAAILPDEARVRQAATRLRAMRKSLGLSGEVTLETLLSLPGLWNGASRDAAAEKAWPAVQKLVEKAVDDLVAAREREGKAIRRDVLQRLETIERHTAEIRKREPAVLQAYRRRLEDRIAALLAEKGLQVSSPDVVKELALYADKVDISEELQRLESHVEEYRKLLESAEPLGRKLDFLVQEMSREANTLSAKGSDAEISRLAVQVKGELEKLKEQAENIE